MNLVFTLLFLLLLCFFVFKIYSSITTQKKECENAGFELGDDFVSCK